MIFNRTIALLCLSLLTASPGFTFKAASDKSEASQLLIDDKVVLGRTERVYFPDVAGFEGVGIPAKTDTGADSTSIHAENITLHPRDSMFDGLEGDELIEAIIEEYNVNRGTELRDREDHTDIMVEFDIPHPYIGELKHYRTPLMRIALVKARDDGGFLYRPVVLMPLTIAGLSVETEVNLANRSLFSTPVLIGKTFLKNNAWVNAGYDYLQEQSHAQIIGRKEHAIVGDLPVDVTISFFNRYSILHAQNVAVDEKTKQVSFTFEGSNNETKNMTLPLVRMLKLKNTPYPMVYVPVQMGEGSFNGNILAYLRDRSKSSSQLRLGTEALNQNFVVDLTQSYLSDKPLRAFSDFLENDAPLIISSEETIAVDGIEVIAMPSVTLKTPLLKVSSIKEVKTDTGREVIFSLIDNNGKTLIMQKDVKKKIKVGDQVRPVIETTLKMGKTTLNTGVSLGLLKKSEGKQAQFVVGYGLINNPIIVNTRSPDALTEKPLAYAGYIEQAQIEGLSFPVKLDTGADVTSMNATDMTFFNKDGEKWVTFTYSNQDGAKQEFTRKVVKEVKIKAREGEKSIPRPVVRMYVKLGEIEEMVDVNLRDRTNFDYSMILGKNFLRHDIVVSSDRQFILTEEK